MSGRFGSITDWLENSPGGLDHERVSAILASFSGIPTLTSISGPEILLRAVGWIEKDGLPKHSRARAFSGYWVRQSMLLPLYGNLSQFEGWLTNQEQSSSAEWRYRALTAICLNWNDFDEFAEMHVPVGETIPCLIGPVAPQPLRDNMSIDSPRTPVLRGGAEQIYFRSGDASPFWVRIRPKTDIF
jgi:hypothetical protein